MEQPTILVVDDDRVLRVGIKRSLEVAGFQVLTAENGQEALERLTEEPISLIISDIAMPLMNGYQLFEKLSQTLEWVNIPFIFLSARSMDSDVRYGKQLGVDDYLPKPVSSDDLLAAVRGKLARAHQRQRVAMHPPAGDELHNGTYFVKRPEKPAPSERLVVGSLTIDTSQHRVWFGGEDVALSGREFQLLRTLAQNAGNVTPMAELLMNTHQLDATVVDAGSLLRPLIRSLRRKLGYETGELGCIESVRGVGYRMVIPD